MHDEENKLFLVVGLERTHLVNCVNSDILEKFCPFYDPDAEFEFELDSILGIKICEVDYNRLTATVGMATDVTHKMLKAIHDFTTLTDQTPKLYTVYDG